MLVQRFSITVPRHTSAVENYPISPNWSKNLFKNKLVIIANNMQLSNACAVIVTSESCNTLLYHYMVANCIVR